MTTSTDQFEQRLRRTLSTVAATITDAPTLSPAPAPSPTAEESLQPHRGPRGRRRRRIGLGVVAVAIPAALVAAAVLRQGPEYVDTIPPETIVVAGSIDGSRYLLVESRRSSTCGPVGGVELVEERENLLGSEWNTVGSGWGEPNGCGVPVPTERWLADPSRYDDGGTRVGDSFVWLWAVHPDVTAVRITAGEYVEELEVYAVDGAGYALFEVPRRLEEYTAELLIDGEVVPGTTEQHTVPEP